jgi:mannose-6-phosphate isomerase
MQPLVLKPILKRIRWGGRRLGDVLGKAIGPESDYAESWEVADHGDDQSVVEIGEWQGWTLRRLVEERNGELFGRNSGRTQFPLLVKLLDASDRLSVQVHPDDARAREFDPAENGKTEAWVILGAAPQSRLYVGLRSDVDEQTLREALLNQTVERCLHAISVTPGECVFVPAGTVHAIGEGILLAEIQQSSNLTFRLYDWGRVGIDGKPRPLHIEEAMHCIDFDRGPVNPVASVKLTRPGWNTDELVRCNHFVMHRHRPETRVCFEGDDRFHVWMILAGQVRITAGDWSRELSVGRTLLLPAARDDVEVQPQSACCILDAFLP